MITVNMVLHVFAMQVRFFKYCTAVFTWKIFIFHFFLIVHGQ